MRRDRNAARGQVHRLTLDSRILEGNPLGDPSTREIHVYTPASHEIGRHLPLLVDLVGFTGSGLSHTNWRAFTENVPERLDRLIGAGAMGPVVVAFPDCYARLGGNQYINSGVIGRYEDYLIQEVLPFVEGHFACGGAGKRAVFGKSSGGYGAIMHGLRRADIWSASPAIPATWVSSSAIWATSQGAERAGQARILDREVHAPFRSLAEADRNRDGGDQSAGHGGDLRSGPHSDTGAFLGIRLPVDLHTGELIAERWENWLACDPALLIERHAESLRKLKGIYIDWRRPRRIRAAFRGAPGASRPGAPRHRPYLRGIPDDHSAVDYRMDRSLPFLEKALRG